MLIQIRNPKTGNFVVIKDKRLIVDHVENPLDNVPIIEIKREDEKNEGE